MKSSIYISAEKIEVIGYAGNAIKQFVTYPLAEGTMINGTITDIPFLTECLSAMKTQYPHLFADPSLIVDGSAILTRRLVTPKLNPKRYRQLVRDDFADSTDNPENLICGYHRLGTEGGREAILACAVNRVLVDSYLMAFRDAGIRLNSIRVGAEALLRYISSRQELKNASFVLTLIDGLTSVSMIFDNGVNVFMSRSRLYGETKEQVFGNVLENLNGMIQFNRSQKFAEISQVFYLGITEADMRLLDALNPYHDIRMELLDLYQNTRGELPPEAHFVYLNTQMSAAIDLVAERRELNKHVRQKKPRKLWIPMMALYVLALAAPTGYFWWQNAQLDNRMEEIRAQLEDESFRERRERLAALRAEMEAYNDVARQRKGLVEWEQSRHMVTSGLLNYFISGYDMVTVVNIDYAENTGIVRIRIESETWEIAMNYVDALRDDQEVVKSVDSPDWRGTYESGLYSINLEITLADKPPPEQEEWTEEGAE
jgi:hypothetical protein